MNVSFYALMSFVISIIMVLYLCIRESEIVIFPLAK